ncbi:MAG: DinB family protein [Thermoanaerobaculia bacterium]
MAESFPEYIDRTLGYVKGRDPLRILQSTPRALERRLAGVPRRRLFTPPAEGKWSAAQILAHQSEMEMLWGYRIRTILEKNGAPIIGIDQDAWAKAGRYERIEPRESLAAFRAIRKANLDLVERLPGASLRRHGNHSQFGRLTIAGILRFLAGHDVNHSLQIEAILGRRRAGR